MPRGEKAYPLHRGRRKLHFFGAGIQNFRRGGPCQEAAQFLPKGCSRKCPFIFLNLNGAVCSNTLFSNTAALTSSLLFRATSTCKILEHLIWSNISGFQFWGPLARTNFLSALCGLPTMTRRVLEELCTENRVREKGLFGKGVFSEKPMF